MSRTIVGRVLEANTGRHIEGARVKITRQSRREREDKIVTYSGVNGDFTTDIPDEDGWSAIATAFGQPSQAVEILRASAEIPLSVSLEPKIDFRIMKTREIGGPDLISSPVANATYEVDLTLPPHTRSIEWHNVPGVDIFSTGLTHAQLSFSAGGQYEVSGTLIGEPWADSSHRPAYRWSKPYRVLSSPPLHVNRVALQRAAVRPTREEDLWTLIRANSTALQFESYREFINHVLGGKGGGNYLNIPEGIRLNRERNEQSSTFGVGAYELLRTATDLFLLLNCRTRGDAKAMGEEFYLEEAARRQRPTPSNLAGIARGYLGNNPYIDQVIAAAFPGQNSSKDAEDGIAISEGWLFRDEPWLIELIWSYWHEEAMLAQSVNALTRRFQNLTGPGGRDALGHFELDPLRPLNNVLWGYVQESYRGLTVQRRSQEYSHQYGFTLLGKANRRTRAAADSRSNFLESFHNLLHRCHQFFKDDSDTTVIADGFPLLNALKEVHLVLSQGAHNQFGDLPWTARGEMLIQQWIMARPEIRDFLQSRAMVRYTEAWMPQVDTMKTLQGWNDVTAERFHSLAVYGEQLLLSIRWGDWVNLNDEDIAKSWARYWRAEIQSYLHSYRAVTGVDLTNPDSIDHTVPAVHLQRRLENQARTR